MYWISTPRVMVGCPVPLLQLNVDPLIQYFSPFRNSLELPKFAGEIITKIAKTCPKPFWLLHTKVVSTLLKKNISQLKPNLDG